MMRVLVADDQEPVRAGLRMLLESQPGIDVVGEAADGVAAVQLARRLRPDVALLDIRMPRLDGIEATALLAGAGVPDPVAVVVITTFDLDEYVHAALRAGAKGFLLKDAGPHLVGEAVRAAASGDALISPKITARLIAEFTPASPRPRSPVVPLTQREEQVLALLASGLTNDEIGERLFLSRGTIKTHIGGILTKLGVRNRVEAAMWAYESGRVRGR
ncbi:DNA-binding response regulator [Aeromicrobium phragmitis]|uniref:DNA-binding response regulator n=1 Tax=Aeromicrobium phragmitis TaxID=2478914 RepID=A0A3L8PI17_9ACTN|nr:response regulator transcription factor [Aeromicrobium phragmitis]RLV54966.1 DNA-binding response regulator [Aeromicrobium phragmitis]